ncbi:PREDICTED: uncharacterized protein LOC108568325 [Nicrophorus vespilloides]|uniref:Uncharacterized protein LOC108568325 n=1 Tax=Nicrophorus vespilloides TaxID=110193 RepID=A0ABM1NDC0_NICVS|nr:PREDICTED: uncharacterized protein LOC108568325 [Nicrophorus vespilloides]
MGAIGVYDFVNIAGGMYLVNIIIMDKLNDVYTFKLTQGCTTVRPLYLFNADKPNITGFQSFLKYEYKHFHGCELTAIAIKYPPYVIDTADTHYPGLEVDLLRDAAKILNFRINFVEHNYTSVGEKLSENNFTYVLKELFGNRVDLVFGMFVDNPMHELETTQYAFGEYLLALAPQARRIHIWKNIFRVMNDDVWLYIVVSIAALQILIFIFHKVLALNNFNYTLVLSILFGNAVPIPVRPSLKMLVAIWIWSSFLITSCYESLIMSFIATSVYQNKFSNMDDIGNMAIGIKSHFHKFVSDDYPTVYYCPLDNTCYERIVEKRDMIMIDTKRSCHYYKIQSGEQVYVSNLKFRFLYSRFVLRKGHPIKRLLDKMIWRYMQNGFLIRWSRKYTDLTTDRATKYSSYVSITIEHLRLPFCVYLGGLTLGSLAFLWENRHRLWLHNN